MNRAEYRGGAVAERLVAQMDARAVLASQPQSLYCHADYDLWRITLHYACWECDPRCRNWTIQVDRSTPLQEDALARLIWQVSWTCPHVAGFVEAIKGEGP